MTNNMIEQIYFVDEVEKKQFFKLKDKMIKLEKHFCQLCNIDQPVRSKHCKICKGCVATFDHHCIWVGNCIGEKNRALFLYYLVIQIFELIVVTLRPLYMVEYHKEIRMLLEDNVILILSLVMNIVFIVNVIILLRYHIFFIKINQTTCKLY